MKSKVPTGSAVSYCQIDTPVGILLIVGDQHGLKLINFQDGPNPVTPSREWRENPQFFRQVIHQIHEYFAGHLTQFSLKLASEGTPFQMKVWKALQTVPYGKTVSYGDIARRIGNPDAARAVGAANGKNPLSIIVPCHRVIGQSGDLVGFGGGLPIKQLLLAHEQGRGNSFFDLKEEDRTTGFKFTEDEHV